ncbi:MAG: DUF308 domain-containing protein [Exiguobacterium profundum]|nr:MAG: DUF308 domain-containing protein [Exiguobacterium profundum]
MSRILFLIVSVLSIIGGIYALLNPVPATLVATVLTGWFFLLYAVVHIVAVFQAEGWGGRLWSILIAVLAFIVGIEVLVNPLENVLTLTLMVAILFLASGIAKIVVSFQLKGTPMLWPVLLSGVASVILGFIILTNFPVSAAVALGFLLGVELLSSGIATLAFAYATRDRA